VLTGLPSIDVPDFLADTLVMSDIKPPAVVEDHPDRDLECQAALSDAFGDLADRAEAAGWSDEEVATALSTLADNRMLGSAQIEVLNDILSKIKPTK
jgi:hypothetical protein